ncbi:MAG TPA: hypothetical protein VF669_08720 [Tepidisphaeraceae bacterium]|jgi:hypothetical protein
MKWTIPQLAAVLSLSMIVGCESSVLVNNRPDTTPNNMSGDDASLASSRTETNSGATSADQASSATTQPSGSQRVNTKNTTIQSD